MSNAEDDNFFGRLIDGVIDKIAVSTRHESSHPLGLLPPADLGKLDQIP